jgi:hypothetical protein
MSCRLSLAQEDAETRSDPASETAKQTDLSIPVSPALTLLGVNPSLVAKPSFTRDFKVDWSFTSYRLAPNLALEAQPIFLLLYDKPELEKYRSAGGLMRTLSTLSVSMATIRRNEEEPRQIAAAVKLNLYRQKDPLMETEQFERAYADYYERRIELLTQVKEFKDSLAKVTDAVDKMNLQLAINSLEIDLVRLKTAQRERNQEIKQQYQRAYWNSSCLDIAFGKIYNYENESIDSLRLADSGFGAWINGSLKAGRSGMLSFIAQYLQNDILQPDQSMLRRSSVLTGVNFRYGSPRYNFFVELVKDNVIEGVSNRNFTIAYGGDLRLGVSVLLSYGIRNVMNEKLELKNLIPVANITCLMR